MFVEKKRLGVSPRLLIANGNKNGLVSVSDARGFFVGQKVVIKSDTQQPRILKVKRFLSPTSFKVGPVDSAINAFSDLSDFLISENAEISAEEQDRPGIADKDYNRAVYAEEPIVAKRSILVDEFGNYYNNENPLPINTEFEGSLTVNTDGFDLSDPDSMQITGSEDGTKTGIKRGARVDSDLDLRVGISDGENKAQVNANSELSVIDSETRAKLDYIISQLAATIQTSDSTAQTILSNILLALASIDSGIPASLGQTTMAQSMPVTIASDQSPISIEGEITATLGDEPIKISGTEDGQPNGAEFPFVNNRLQQILKAKDRVGTISYADFGTKDQRITQISYTAPSIGTGVGFTAVKTFTYTLVGNRYRRDTPGDWSLV